MTAANQTPTPVAQQLLIQMKPISLTINGAAIGPIQTPDGLLLALAIEHELGIEVIRHPAAYRATFCERRSGFGKPLR